MPPLEETDLHQEAIFRTITGKDRYNEPTFSTPVQITCRWDESRRETIGPDGTPIAVDAVVITSQELPDGAILWKGILADYEASSNPEQMQVVSVSKTPSLNARITRFQYGLARYKNTKTEDE